jgi:hypothetical protein
MLLSSPERIRMLIALLGGAVVLTPWVEFALQQAALIT